MTDQEINVAVAECCGWENVREEEYPHRWLWRKDGEGGRLFDEPDDYCADLNAMHEAEQLLARNGHTQTEIRSFYTRMLLKVVGSLNPELPWLVATATARQRAEALLRTLGKWKDGGATR